MGIKDWFSRDAKDARAVAKWHKRLMNKYQQTAERKRAIEALGEIGSDEAVSALLQRYQYRTEATIVDEDEKEQVYQTVVGLGERAIPALIQYVQNEQAVYWPVKALRAIVGDEEAARQVVAALDAIGDSFGQNQARREQLVDNLRSFAEQDVVYNKLLELMHDEDEEIVIRAIDGLSGRKDPKVGDAVIPLLVDPETSHRVRTLGLEMMIENQWLVPRDQKQALRDLITEAYFIDDTGVVRRR